MLGVRGSRGEGLAFCRCTEHHTAHFRLMWREESSLNLNELVKVAFAKEWHRPGGFTGGSALHNRSCWVWLRFGILTCVSGIRSGGASGQEWMGMWSVLICQGGQQKCP